MEILELMKHKKSSTDQPTTTKNKGTENNKNNMENPNQASNQPTTAENDIENKIAIAKLEISNSIRNGTKINKERAAEIRELMKKSNSHQATNNAKEATTNEQNTSKTTDKPNKSQTEEQREEELIPCPIICNMKVHLDDYVDHMLECEKKLESCKKCGPDYLSNDIHRETEKHSKVTQRFDCMDCMKAMGVRISIARNHKITCQGSGTGKFIYKKSPEYASQELHEAYDEDTKVREILEDSFKKRSIIHLNKKKKSRDTTFNILSIIGLILTIYISMYIIAQAERSDSNTNKISIIQTNPGKIAMQPETQQNKKEKTDPHPDPNKKKDKPKWRSKNRESNEQQKISGQKKKAHSKSKTKHISSSAATTMFKKEPSKTTEQINQHSKDDAPNEPPSTNLTNRDDRQDKKEEETVGDKTLKDFDLQSDALTTRPPLTATFKLLGLNWCQSVKDDSSCRDIILNIAEKFLHLDRFDGNNEESLIAIFKLLGIAADSTDWCQNIKDYSNCHNRIPMHTDSKVQMEENSNLDSKVQMEGNSNLESKVQMEENSNPDLNIKTEENSNLDSDLNPDSNMQIEESSNMSSDVQMEENSDPKSNVQMDENSNMNSGRFIKRGVIQDKKPLGATP